MLVADDPGPGPVHTLADLCAKGTEKPGDHFVVLANEDGNTTERARRQELGLKNQS